MADWYDKFKKDLAASEGVRGRSQAIEGGGPTRGFGMGCWQGIWTKRGSIWHSSMYLHLQCSRSIEIIDRSCRFDF